MQSRQLNPRTSYLSTFLRVIRRNESRWKRCFRHLRISHLPSMRRYSLPDGNRLRFCRASSQRAPVTHSDNRYNNSSMAIYVRTGGQNDRKQREGDKLSEQRGQEAERNELARLTLCLANYFPENVPVLTDLILQQEQEELKYFFSFFV